MTETGLDLISTADIARLAGQSRAAVGNWKSRNPDFPPERGHSPRGPLYDRAEVTSWLESTGRLASEQRETVAARRITSWLMAESGATQEDSLLLLLVLLAVRSSSGEEWNAIRLAPPGALDEAIRSVASSIFSLAAELVPRETLPPRLAKQVVDALSEIERPQVPLLADALLEQFSSAMRHRSGEYLTPPGVRKLVTALAGPAESVYNPASGLGQLLVDMAAAANSGRHRCSTLAGQEISVRIWVMSQLNLLIHDVVAQVEQGDVFANDRFPQLRAQRVVAVPPWNQKLPQMESLRDDPRWVWGELGPNDSNAAWIEHCLHHLADGGRAVLVLANAALFEGGRAGRIRQRIIKAGLLDAVIALPPGLFDWTTAACAVLVFSKGRAVAQGKPAPTLMIDVRDSADSHTTHPVLGERLIGKVAGIYARWAAGKAPESEIAALADYDMLASGEFVIDPGRYVSPLPSTPNLSDALRKRAELLDRLNILTETSRNADDQLRNILEERQ